MEAGYDAAIGTLAHAWLERIGRDGIAAWPATALASRLSAMRRQLTRAGIPASQADAAAEAVLETLQATLSDPRGQWLLSQSGARREWPLIDAAGKISVIDLALSTEDGWLIVDYKTGRSQPGESAEAFAARMRQRHGEQLRRYCAQVTALDGRPTRAALYFPGARVDRPLTQEPPSMHCPVPRQSRLVALCLARCVVVAIVALPAASHALSPATHAERTSCAGEGKTLRSRDAARPTQVEFINHGKEIKTIYWLNYEGRRVYYARLQPGDSYIQKTYVSHPWS